MTRKRHVGSLPMTSDSLQKSRKSHVGSQRVLTRCSPVILFLRESKSFLKNWEGGWEEKSGRSHKKEQGAHGPPRFGEVLASVDAGLDVDCSK